MSTTTARPVHPTAQAFFRALDDASVREEDDDKRSGKIRKQSQTVGWRNRYSQSEWYPITIKIGTTTTTTRSCDIQVRQVQRGEVEGTYGTGATVWPASLVLIKYLEKNPHLLQEKSVIDLGSGTGVTSIAAAVLQSAHVVCTDGTDSVVQLAQDNVTHNAQRFGSSSVIATNIHVRKYWWGDGSISQTFDVILVSDCVLPKLYPIAPLVKAIGELCHAHSVAILSYEHRYYPDYDPRDKFRELCESRGLQMRLIPLSEQDPVYSVEDIEIWEVRRRSV
jgi:predicted nicotinamide N-methyase